MSMSLTLNFSLFCLWSHFSSNIRHAFQTLVFFVPDRGNGKTIVRSENRYRGGISSMVASKPMFSSLPAGMYLRKLTSSKAYVLTNLI